MTPATAPPPCSSCLQWHLQWLLHRRHCIIRRRAVSPQQIATVVAPLQRRRRACTAPQWPHSGAVWHPHCSAAAAPALPDSGPAVGTVAPPLHCRRRACPAAALTVALKRPLKRTPLPRRRRPVVAPTVAPQWPPLPCFRPYSGSAVPTIAPPTAAPPLPCCRPYSGPTAATVAPPLPRRRCPAAAPTVALQCPLLRP